MSMAKTRGILIADKEGAGRQQMADFFRKEGYQVETTDSAGNVLGSILDKKLPVLVMGSDFDQKVAPANLIHLLKKCNRHLTIILVSDSQPPSQERKIREEGIFYHALKPQGPEDNEELRQAVECAFHAFKKALRPQ
jgi:DNA-binding NtrC family response regulator